MTSEEQHAEDIDKDIGHHKAGGSEGGKCLNRHVADSPEDGDGNSCSHRWQAYLQMGDDKSRYNGDAYKSLVGEGRIKTFFEDGYPEHYQATIGKPKAGQWDWGKSSKPIGSAWGGDKPKPNFYWKCFHPYWHEAHHIVPNSTLRNVIIKFAKTVAKGEKLVTSIRRGLLSESYNLNEKVNMIMLPLDKPVAQALGLPRHRKTVAHRNHSTYSKHVEAKLEEIFSALQQELVEHKKPKYKNLKDRIENLAATLHGFIIDSEAKSLDEMEESEFPTPLF